MNTKTIADRIDYEVERAEREGRSGSIENIILSSDTWNLFQSQMRNKMSGPADPAKITGRTYLGYEIIVNPAAPEGTVELGVKL